jgi:hypothetical protein
LVAKEARAWITHINKYELSCAAGFKSFGARILGLVDLTFIQLWDPCTCAKSIEDVDFSQICLNSNRSDILQNYFIANKPVYLVMNTKKQQDDDDKDLEDPIRKKNKLQDQKDKDIKDKLSYRDLGCLVKNSQTNQDWIIPGSKYKTIFTREVNAAMVEIIGLIGLGASRPVDEEPNDPPQMSRSRFSLNKK